MYAIVRAGGRQYKVSPDTVISVDRLKEEVGAKIALTDVLLVSDDDSVRIGTPNVPGATVNAEVIEQYRDKKIRGFTYKPTKRIRRRYGHRQQLTRLKVIDIKA